MPTNRDISLEEFGISKWRVRELKYFCLQYNEKKQQTNDIIGLHGIAYGQPKGTNRGSAVENQAIKLARINDEIKLIEQTAIEAEPGIYKYILKNVTENIPYEYMDVPCGRRQFYEARRKFFYLLSAKR